MDYKEKYNGALERARDLMTNQNPPAFDKHLIETIFPELVAESEEEKMKKAIMHVLYENYTDAAVIEGVEIAEIVAWLGKQGEQPTNKVESYFKVGDWMILNGVVTKILDKQKYGFIGLDIDGKDFFCNYGHTDLMRLWSINDAKDGDVLVSSTGNPFIFSGKYDNIHFDNPIAYCGVTCENKFREGTGAHWTGKCGVAPATKEQRDLLFSKMRESGYEWDPEKKELKKIEVASKESEDERIRKGIIRNLQYLMDRSEGFVKEDLQERIAWLEKQGKSTITNIEIPFWANDSELQEVSYNIPEGFYAEIKDDRVVIKKVEPKFKVGDFITNGYCSGKVIGITDDAYLLDTGQGILFSCENTHLWTVNDAKDGDVLAINWHKDDDFWEKIIIFKKYHNKGVKGLYSMPCVEGYGNTFKNGKLAFQEEIPYYSETWTDNLHPATKEQRELLFKEIHDAGYEWDAEKKELEKMEVASKESKDEKIKQDIISYLRNEKIVKRYVSDIEFDKWIAWVEKQESVGEIVERCKTSWYNEGKIDSQIEGLSDDEKYQQGWHDALEKQGKQKQSWKPSIAQKIVIKELIEDKNTSNVHKTILRGMLDEFKQFTNNYKRETDNYEVEDSSQT